MKTYSDSSESIWCLSSPKKTGWEQSDVLLWLRCGSLAGAGHEAAAAGTRSRWLCTLQRAGGCLETVCVCPGVCHAHPTAAGTRCAEHPQMTASLPVTSSDSLLVLLGNAKKQGLCQKLCHRNSAMKIHTRVKR